MEYGMDESKNKSLIDALIKKTSNSVGSQIEVLLNKTDNNKSGFFDLPKEEICKDLSHYPPSMMSIPYGKGYRHVCPTCGKVTTIINRISY